MRPGCIHPMPPTSHLIWLLFSDLATLLVPDLIKTPVFSAILQTHPASGSVWFCSLVLTPLGPDPHRAPPLLPRRPLLKCHLSVRLPPHITKYRQYTHSVRTPSLPLPLIFLFSPCHTQLHCNCSFIYCLCPSLQMSAI